MKIIRFFKDIINFRHTIAELNLRISKLEFQVNNPPLFNIGDKVRGETITNIVVRYDSVLNIKNSKSKSDFKISTANKLGYFYYFKQSKKFKGLIPQRGLKKQ